MTALDRIAENWKQLRSLPRSGSPGGLSGDQPGMAAPEPMEETILQGIEQEFEVSLPEEYRSFLLKFGDGRVGPGTMRTVREGLSCASKRTFPLSSPVLGSGAFSYQELSSEQQQGELEALFRAWDAIPKEDGVARLCDYGGGIYGVLVLNGPYRGRVWMLQADTGYYGPFGGSEPLHDESVTISWNPSDHPRDYSFLEWYESWLNGKLKMAGIMPL
jgi:hypothetical protein